MHGSLAARATPGGGVRFRADAAAWLERTGHLKSGQASGNSGRVVFGTQPGRENARYEVGPRGVPAFEKKNLALSFSDLRKAWHRAGHATSPLMHEWDMLWLARARGLLVPEPVAVGVTRRLGVPRSEFLITDTLPGEALDAYLDRTGPPAGNAGAALAKAVALAVATLHDAGIVFPDMFAKHVFLQDAGSPSCRAGFIDLESAYTAGTVTHADRARNLGALAATLPYRLSPRVLARFLRAYVARAGAWTFREAWRATSHAARHYLVLRRFRHALTPRLECCSIAPGPRGAGVARFLACRFDIPFAAPAAAPAVLDDAHSHAFERLVTATFHAGVLPPAHPLPYLRDGGGGTLAWDIHTPLRAPRHARAILAWWPARRIARDAARCALSPRVKQRLVRRLRHNPIHAFALAEL